MSSRKSATAFLAPSSSPAIGQRAAVRAAGRAGEPEQVPEVDVVERLDHVRLRQVRLEELGDGGRLVVELGDVAVALGVVVVGVDHDLAAQRLDRDLAVALQRDRHHDDVPRLRSLLRGGGPGVRPRARPPGRSGSPAPGCCSAPRRGPAATASRATVLPMCPAPMSPMVVMGCRTARNDGSFRAGLGAAWWGDHRVPAGVPLRRNSRAALPKRCAALLCFGWAILGSNQ